MVAGRAHNSLFVRLDRRGMGQSPEVSDAMPLPTDAKFIGSNMHKGFAAIISAYDMAIDWIADHPRATFWLALAALVLARSV